MDSDAFCTQNIKRTRLPGFELDSFNYNSFHATETGISSHLMGHVVRKQTYPYLTLNCLKQIEPTTYLSSRILIEDAEYGQFSG